MHCVGPSESRDPPGFLRFPLTVPDAPGRPVLPRICVRLRPTATRLLLPPLGFLAVLMFLFFLFLFLLFSAYLCELLASVTVI